MEICSRLAEESNTSFLHVFHVSLSSQYVQSAYPVSLGCSTLLFLHRKTHADTSQSLQDPHDILLVVAFSGSVFPADMVAHAATRRTTREPCRRAPRRATATVAVRV